MFVLLCVVCVLADVNTESIIATEQSPLPPLGFPRAQWRQRKPEDQGGRAPWSLPFSPRVCTHPAGRWGAGQGSGGQPSCCEVGAGCPGSDGGGLISTGDGGM